MRKLSASPVSDAFDDMEDIPPAKAPPLRRRAAVIAGFEEEDTDFRLEGRASSVLRKPAGFAARKYRNLPQAATIFGAAFGALMVAVAVNALAFQKERHPAPLFDQSVQGQEAAPMPLVRPQAAAPLPPRSQQAAHAPEPAAVPAPPNPARVAAPKLPERPRDATASLDRQPKDPVGDLLRAGHTPEQALREPSAAVAAIQRTLARLGYGVTIDGLIGPATQAAISRFEKDHRMPVKGQLTAKLFREITAAQAQLPR